MAITRTWETLNLSTGERHFIAHTPKVTFTIYAYPFDGEEWYGAFIGDGLITSSENRYCATDVHDWLVKYGADESQIVGGVYGCLNGCGKALYDDWEYCPTCGNRLGILCDDLPERLGIRQ